MPAVLRRLLLATEGTSFDAGAERLALALAARLAAPLTIVVPFASNEELLTTEPGIALQAEAAVGATLRRLAAAGAGAGVAVTTVVRRGSALAHEIVAAANADAADLVFTRRVGKRGFLARLLVGEMVSQVAALAARPVLMVPADAMALWTGRVLVPRGPLAANVDALAAALGAAAGVRVEAQGADPADLAGVVACASAADLVVAVLQPGDVASGRLDKTIAAAVGSAPCPTVLVPALPDAPRRRA